MKVRKQNNNDNRKKEMLKGNEFVSLVILAILVTVIFFAFYGITLLVDKTPKPMEPGILEETIQYNEIIYGQTLEQPYKEYYVLVMNPDNNYNDLYMTYLDVYMNNEKGAKYYTVDLDNAFNSNYNGEETKVDKQKPFVSKFSNTTLLKIKNKKIDKVYSEHDSILALLKKLAA